MFFKKNMKNVRLNSIKREKLIKIEQSWNTIYQNYQY